MKHILSLFLKWTVIRSKIRNDESKKPENYKEYHRYDGTFTDDDIGDNFEEAQVFFALKECERKKELDAERKEK
ncbi:hypothetical protein GVAV_002442 [Gurleya vavrai]